MKSSLSSLPASRRKQHMASWPVFCVLAVLFVSLTLGVIFASGVSFASQGHHKKGGSGGKGGGQHNTQGAADAVFNCTLTVPIAPLTAQGLATPYLLSGPGQGNGGNAGGDANTVQQNQGNGNSGQQGCRENNMNTSAFVEATILDPATGRLSVYRPLVVDTANPTPLLPPTVPPLPAGSVVALDFGFNGTNLTLKDTTGGQTLQQANCVNGLNGNIFGQIAFCDQTPFYQAVNQAIAQGKLTVPPLGTGQDGQTCATTNDPSVGDMDPNDNTNTTYLLVGDRVAQDTPANAQRLAGQNPQAMANGSDTGLLANFIDKSLGCSSFNAPDVTDPNGQVSTTTEQLSQVFATANQAKAGRSVNYIPPTDKMAEITMMTPNLDKLNLAREQVNQPPATQADLPTAGTVTYCQNLLQFGIAKIALDKPITQNFGSPMPMVANNLFTFLANRFMVTFGANGLNCVKLLHVTNPVKVTMEKNIVVAATIDVALVPGGGSPVTPPTSGTVAVLVDGTPLVGATATINGASSSVAVNGTTVTITSSVTPKGTTGARTQETGITVIVDGTPLNGTTAIINGAPATVTVAGTTVTITSSVGKPTPGTGTPTATGIRVIVDGTPLNGSTTTINGATATITINGTTVTIVSSKGAPGTGTPTVAVVVDGTPIASSTTAINGAPATISVTGTTLAITSSTGATSTPGTGAGTTTGVNVLVDGTPLTGTTATINGASATVTSNGNTVAITSSVKHTGSPGLGGSLTTLYQWIWRILVDGSASQGQTSTPTTRAASPIAFDAARLTCGSSA